MAISIDAVSPRPADGRTGGASSSTILLPWLWMAALALASQLLLIKGVGPATAQPPLWVGAVFATHLLLVPFLVRNWRYLGLRLVLVGLSLNLCAMAANGGLMPVGSAGLEAVGQESAGLTNGDPIPGSKDVYLHDPRMPQLSDVVVLRLPGGLTHVASIGDLVIAVGTLVALASISRAVVGSAHPLGAEASRRA